MFPPIGALLEPYWSLIRNGEVGEEQQQGSGEMEVLGGDPGQGVPGTSRHFQAPPFLYIPLANTYYSLPT